MNNRDRLIDLIVSHRLERREVARLLSVDLDTVHRWLLPAEVRDRLEVPAMAVELLELKLAARPARGQGGTEALPPS